jgi:hypothetical protein
MRLIIKAYTLMVSLLWEFLETFLKSNKSITEEIETIFNNLQKNL